MTARRRQLSAYATACWQAHQHATEVPRGFGMSDVQDLIEDRSPGWLTHRRAVLATMRLGGWEAVWVLMIERWREVLEAPALRRARRREQERRRRDMKRWALEFEDGHVVPP